MRKRLRFLAPLLTVGLVAAGCAGGDGSDDTGSGEFPRDETVFTSGSQWGAPSSWNPYPGTQATGVRGLIFETLFTFNIETAELQPHLAESGGWVEDTVFEVVLREGIEWTDGEPMTADDVVFTAELGQIEGVPFSDLWNYLDSVEAVDERTVRFTFSEPRQGQWDIWRYATEIVPEHIWSEVPDEEIMSFANEEPVGSGSYMYHSHNEQRFVMERNDDWWGTDAFDIEMNPRYIIDVVNPSNEVALGMISRGNMDLSNNFLPGIDQLVQGDFNITTYYPDAPYMLAANTAYLIPNTTVPPMDDAAFRRAMAYSIDVGSIVENVYSNIVAPASPTGLHPVWVESGHVDSTVLSENGFAEDMAASYNPDTASQILADAGYEDANDDGFVETPDGDEIDLSLLTPAGWTDWNGAADVIVSGLQEVGINAVSETPDAGAVDDARTTGEFELLLNNWSALDATPWTHYDYMFHLPVQDQQPTLNFARYENEQAWELTQQAGTLAATDPALSEVEAQLQEILLQDMPAIPLWYNGVWSQANNDVWTNWPSEGGDTSHIPPVTWGGWFERGATFMFAEIEPAG